jgi:hypothetical protein
MSGFVREASESQCARDRSGNTGRLTEGKPEELERIARSGRRPDAPKINSTFDRDSNFYRVSVLSCTPLASSGQRV